MATPGEPAWLELSSTDLARAQHFYGELLGWQFEDRGPDYGGYHLITVDDVVVGGGLEITDDMRELDATDGFGIYLATGDIAETVAKAERHASEVVLPPMAVAEHGQMAYLIDPVGSDFGLWQSEDLQTLARDRAGGVCWWELMTRHYDDAVRFYGDVFGVDVVPIGEQVGSGRYSTIAVDGRQVAGICDASAFIGEESGPSFWRIYLGVRNLDEALAKVGELGGKVLDGPFDSDYGRIATVSDDQGAHFQLLEVTT